MAERKMIYLDDALEAIRKLSNAGIHWFVSAEAVFDALLKLSSAQPERPEIIHCRDCKFARMTYDGECKYCDIWFPDEKVYMDGDYFCASAERRTDE